MNDDAAERRPRVGVIAPYWTLWEHTAGPTCRADRLALVRSVATELAGHNRPEVLETLRARFQSMERMQAVDIADAITYIVTRPRHVAINEMLIRPTEQDQ